MPVRMDDFHDRWSRVRDHDSVAGTRWRWQAAVTLLVQVIGDQMIKSALRPRQLSRRRGCPFPTSKGAWRPRERDRVSFEAKESAKGPRAENVAPLEEVAT